MTRTAVQRPVTTATASSSAITGGAMVSAYVLYEVSQVSRWAARSASLTHGTSAAPASAPATIGAASASTRPASEEPVSPSRTRSPYAARSIASRTTAERPASAVVSANTAASSSPRSRR